MESNTNLILIGMMGSGKSTIGSLLSKNLNFKFIDVDFYIEKKTGKKISEIFEKEGEAYFRKLEEKVTIDILNSRNTVISLGGGGFINNKIREEVLSNHISFWLNWNILTLLNRIKKNKKRPLVNKLNEKEQKELFLERSKIYNLADYKIDCEKLSKNEIVQKIKNIYVKN